jgi:hypothetical protein
MLVLSASSLCFLVRRFSGDLLAAGYKGREGLFASGTR